MNTKYQVSYKKAIYGVFEITRDFFAALGVFTFIFATIFYSLGYFS